MDRRGVESFRIEAKVHDRLALRRGEARRQVGCEFFYQERHAFGPAAAVADGIFDGDFRRARAVFEEDFNGVSDRALVAIEIFFRIARIFDAGHFVSERIDARILGDFVFVVIGAELAEN